jgi:hypothetical protein
VAATLAAALAAALAATFASATAVASTATAGGEMGEVTSLTPATKEPTRS